MDRLVDLHPVLIEGVQLRMDAIVDRQDPFRTTFHGQEVLDHQTIAKALNHVRDTAHPDIARTIRVGAGGQLLSHRAGELEVGGALILVEDVGGPALGYEEGLLLRRDQRETTQQLLVDLGELSLTEEGATLLLRLAGQLLLNQLDERVFGEDRLDLRCLLQNPPTILGVAHHSVDGVRHGINEESLNILRQITHLFRRQRVVLVGILGRRLHYLLRPTNITTLYIDVSGAQFFNQSPNFIDVVGLFSSSLGQLFVEGFRQHLDDLVRDALLARTIDSDGQGVLYDPALQDEVVILIERRIRQQQFDQAIDLRSLLLNSGLHIQTVANQDGLQSIRGDLVEILLLIRSAIFDELVGRHPTLAEIQTTLGH